MSNGFSVTVDGVSPTITANGTQLASNKYSYDLNPDCTAYVDLCVGGCGPKYYFTWYPSYGILGGDMHSGKVSICRPSASTTYTVSVIDLDNATSNDFGCCQTAYIIINPTNGAACTSGVCLGYVPERKEQASENKIVKQIENNKLFISPNPTDGSVVIKWSNNDLEEDSRKIFRIFDLRGKLVGQIVVTNEEQLNLDISSLPPGFYIAELLDSKGKLRGKILKQ